MVRCDHSDVEQAWALGRYEAADEHLFEGPALYVHGTVSLQPPRSTVVGASDAWRADKPRSVQVHHHNPLERLAVLHLGLQAAFAGSELRIVP